MFFRGQESYCYSVLVEEASQCGSDRYGVQTFMNMMVGRKD